MEIYVSGLTNTSGPAVPVSLHAWISDELWVHDLKIKTLNLFIGDVHIKFRPIDCEQIEKFGKELIAIAEKFLNRV